VTSGAGDREAADQAELAALKQFPKELLTKVRLPWYPASLCKRLDHIYGPIASMHARPLLCGCHSTWHQVCSELDCCIAQVLQVLALLAGQKLQHLERRLEDQ
jgi:hypothetical protein